MKNEKLEMTVALNGFLSKYQNYDTKKEDLIVIKDWEELKQYLLMLIKTLMIVKKLNNRIRNMQLLLVIS